MEKILVSACLLGNNCTYEGSNNLRQELLDLKHKYDFIPFCPEVSGGLLIPRIPAEIKDNKVINKSGIDVTKEYEKGASLALELCKKYNIKLAILKEKSPSCGVNLIFDGTFSKQKIFGSGITTRLLKENGIKVISDVEIDLLK